MLPIQRHPFKMMIQKLFLAIFFLLSSSFHCFAESIELTSGQKIQAKIIVRNDDYIKVDLGVGVPVTYYSDEIASIDNEPFTSALATPPSAVPKDIPSVNQVTDTVAPPAPVVRTPLDNQALDYQKAMMTSKPLAPAGDYLDSQIDIQKIKLKAKIESIKKEHPQLTQVGLEIQIFLIDAKQWPKELIEKLKPFAGFLILAYFLFSFLLMKIGQRLNGRSYWMAWVPLIQLLYILKLADKPFSAVILFFVPAVNFIIFIFVWIKIMELLQKPSWLAILMIIPGVNLGLMGYLAFCKTK